MVKIECYWKGTISKLNCIKSERSWNCAVLEADGPKYEWWLNTQLKAWRFDVHICSTSARDLVVKRSRVPRKFLQWMFYMTGDLTTIKQVQFELSSRNWKKEKRHECFNQPQSYYISHSINLHSSLSNHRMKNHLSQPLSN